MGLDSRPNTGQLFALGYTATGTQAQLYTLPPHYWRADDGRCGLYTVNLTTGATTLVGAIGNGLATRNIAVAGTTGVVTAVRRRPAARRAPNPALGCGLLPAPACTRYV